MKEKESVVSSIISITGSSVSFSILLIAGRLSLPFFYDNDECLLLIRFFCFT